MTLPAPSAVKYLVCVNDSDHSRVMLRFACARAKKRGSHIDLLHVMEPADYQGILSVADKIRDERRTKAESLMQDLSTFVQQHAGSTPGVVLREGVVEEQIIQAVQEDVDVHMIMLGASGESDGRHTHITGLVRALGDKLMIPLLILPGTLTDQQIADLA
jgi:nucleotide-binding universal stress UspA family protein